MEHPPADGGPGCLCSPSLPSCSSPSCNQLRLRCQEARWPSCHYDGWIYRYAILMPTFPACPSPSNSHITANTPKSRIRTRNVPPHPPTMTGLTQSIHTAAIHSSPFTTRHLHFSPSSWPVSPPAFPAPADTPTIPPAHHAGSTGISDTNPRSHMPLQRCPTARLRLPLLRSGHREMAIQGSDRGTRRA